LVDFRSEFDSLELDPNTALSLSRIPMLEQQRMAMESLTRERGKRGETVRKGRDERERQGLVRHSGDPP
jgi:hypothetical protein